MRQGAFAAAALALVVGVAPAGAAPSSPHTVVYEVVRTSKAPLRGTVTVATYSDAGEAVTMSANLVPDGGGYRSDGRRLFASLGSETRSVEIEVDLSSGRRFLTGGVKGRFRVAPRTPGWSVREAGRGFRIVNAGPGDLHAAGPVGIETFGGTTAPAGAYGSVAFAHLPCGAGAGTWTFSNDAEPWSGPPNTCSPVDDGMWGETRRGRTWILDADVVGLNDGAYDTFDVRIAVLDLPRLSPRR